QDHHGLPTVLRSSEVDLFWASSRKENARGAIILRPCLNNCPLCHQRPPSPSTDFVPDKFRTLSPRRCKNVAPTRSMAHTNTSLGRVFVVQVLELFPGTVANGSLRSPQETHRREGNLYLLRDFLPSLPHFNHGYM